MILSKGTRYALYAAAELALAEKDDRVTVNLVAQRHHLPHAVLAKVFQRLAHAGIAVGERGSRGGYHLARRAEDVSLLDIVQAFERTQAEPRRSAAQLAPLRDALDEIDSRTRRTFAAISLRRLAGPWRMRGPRGRPAARRPRQREAS